jgi:thiol-disulfide isomerase/thioredoxin
MILRLFVVTGWLLAGSSLFAVNLKLNTLTIGAITYSNVSILGANASDLFFTHDHGITNVKLKYLNPDLQKQFNYDPVAAAQAERKQIENDSLYRDYIATKIVAEREQAARAAQAAQAAQAAAEAVSSGNKLADPISDRSLLGKPAPALDADKWVGSKPVSEGKFVLVSFWAPSSVPCRKWISEWNDLQKKFADKLVVIGVTSAAESEIAQMDEPKIEFPCAIDSSARFTSAVGVTSIPCIMLVDPGHKVLYQGHPGALSGEILQSILEKPSE